MAFVGVDGCPDGWLVLRLDEHGEPRARCFASFVDVWEAHADAETILVDVPIGLREESGEPRPCDSEARRLLGHPRSTSVFEPPVRAALAADTYEQARAINEAHAGKSLSAQSWGIAGKIREVDRFLRATEPARGTVREAHPEVCLWALNGRQAMRTSKTREPEAAFRERRAVLERVCPGAGRELDALDEQLACSGSIDDLVDAFALAQAAHPMTGPLASLPSDEAADDEDAHGLPMRIHHPEPTEGER